MFLFSSLLPSQSAHLLLLFLFISLPFSFPSSLSNLLPSFVHLLPFFPTSSFSVASSPSSLPVHLLSLSSIDSFIFFSSPFPCHIFLSHSFTSLLCQHLSLSLTSLLTRSSHPSSSFSPLLSPPVTSASPLPTLTYGKLFSFLPTPPHSFRTQVCVCEAEVCLNLGVLGLLGCWLC